MLLPKNYVDSRKPLITVWAEQKENLTAGAHECSFGNGADGTQHGQNGYTMLTSGRLLRMGICSSSDRQNGNASVWLTVNGVEKQHFLVEKENNSYPSVKVFDTPLELLKGDRINFRTKHSNRDINCAVVNVLIELDL